MRKKLTIILLLLFTVSCVKHDDNIIKNDRNSQLSMGEAALEAVIADMYRRY